MNDQNPPADDVREALGKVHYCPEHGDLLTGPRSLRCSDTHSVEQILTAFAVRPRGTFTDTEKVSVETPKPGLYRNELGMELLVTGAWLPNLQGERRQILGDIATAQTPTDLFGVTHYLVTSRSLTAAGYAFIPREARS